MGARSRDGAFESRAAPHLIAGLIDGAVEDIGVKANDVIGVQVQQRNVAPLVGHRSVRGVAAVVGGENPERFPMLGDETLSPAAD